MSGQDNLIKEFSEITGTEGDKARTFLASSAWRLDVALTKFYDSFGAAEEGSVSAMDSFVDSEEMQDSLPREPTANDLNERPKITTRRLATMASLRSDDSLDDDRQAFYAGGSEHSGQQVLGPDNSDKTEKDREFIARLLQEAHEQGEIADEDEEMPEVRHHYQPHQSTHEIFSGVGYRLGQTNDDSMMVPSERTGSTSPSNRREVILKLWREGFSVDDGALREYTDPTNLEFLNKIRRGRIPDELIAEAEGGSVHLNMEDHSHERYIQPKQKVKAFTGAGHVLGSPTPSFSGNESKTTQEENTKSDKEVDKKDFCVDPNLPQTTIQVRLADGSRMQATFNNMHTIRDVRSYIEKIHPQYLGRSYTLMIFPNRELNNDELTLEEAGILSSCILQRLK